VSAPSATPLAPLTIVRVLMSTLINLPTDKVGNAAKNGVPFADRATEPPIEKTDHALRAVVLITADRCIIYALAEQGHGARRRTNSYWPASQSDLLPPADDDTPINTVRRRRTTLEIWIWLKRLLEEDDHQIETLGLLEPTAVGRI